MKKRVMILLCMINSVVFAGLDDEDSHLLKTLPIERVSLEMDCGKFNLDEPTFRESVTKEACIVSVRNLAKDEAWNRCRKSGGERIILNGSETMPLSKYNKKVTKVRIKASCTLKYACVKNKLRRVGSWHDGYDED